MRRVVVCAGVSLLLSACRGSGEMMAPVLSPADGASDRGPSDLARGDGAPVDLAPAVDRLAPVDLAAPVDQAAAVDQSPSPPPDAASAGGRAPDPRFLPRPSGVCPELAAGMVTVRPGGTARQVRVWMTDAARTLDGPLVFYWYGTGGSPAQAEQALGAATMSAITAAGGLVVAPVHDPAAGTWPWFLVSGTVDNDLRVADEVLACAVEKVGIDLRRVHALGFSAGAIHTVQMSYRRSGYLASVVTFSGAQAGPIPDQDSTNKLAAMIFHGGASDRVIIGFQQGSERYKADLQAAGRFALICNHGLGHRIPTADAPGVWRFLQDHPFGTAPEPYTTALPPQIPPSCMR
jgi:predicted esterase